MQHTLTDHFSEYHALQPAAKYARCDDALDCKDGMPIGLLGCTGTGEVGMASHHVFHNESTRLIIGEYTVWWEIIRARVHTPLKISTYPL